MSIKDLGQNCTRMVTLMVACGSLAVFAQQPQPEPATPAPDAEKTVQQLIKEAYESTNDADTFEEYDRVVKLCDAALAKGPTAAGRAYLMQLSAWAINRRGKELSKQAAETEEAAAAEQLEARAMADFQESVRRDPDKWQAIHNRGVSYAMLGEFDKALADFDRTIELNAKYPNAWFNRGEIHYENGDYAAAVRDYTQAINLKPEDAGAHGARAHAYYQLRRFQSALSEFTRAIEISPADAALRADRGDVQASLGNWQQAAADYREAVKLDDELGRAYMGAAWVMATCPDERFRDAKLAVQSAEKAIDLDGTEDWRYHDTLAAAYAEAGQYEAAQAALAKALAKAPAGLLDTLQARLQLYADGKPFRDTVRVTP